MTNLTGEQLQKYMERITNLLAKADSTEYPEEAKTFRAKAQELMQKYRLDEANLLAADPGSLKPIWIDFDLCPLNSDYLDEYVRIMSEADLHAEVMTAWSMHHTSGMARVHATGFESDIRLFEWLLNSARLAFRDKLEPEVDQTLTDEENIYRLRSAGVTRTRVAYLLWGSDAKDGVAHGKVGRIYKAECRRRGEEPALDGRGMSLAAYRESYATSFVSRFANRLREARSGVMTTGGDIVLKGRAEAVKESFYGRFPSLRPGAPAKRGAVTKRPSQTYRQSAADKHYFSAAAEAGRRAGRSAADDVEISRNPGTGRIGA
jgi:uncharacterized protein YoaH (UPF0181 family)